MIRPNRATVAGALLALAFLLAACAPAGTVLTVGEEPAWRSDWSVRSMPSSELDLVARPVASGLVRPVDIAAPGDGTARLLVGQQEGTIVAVHDGAIAEPPVLDVRDRVACCGEQGLLGFAPHPHFGRNGWLFVHYTDVEGASVLSRFVVDADSGRADPSSEAILLRVPQPGGVHNGGQIGFGPDAHLYVGIGEGEYTPSWLGTSSAAQDLGVLLGKVLRLDVSRGTAYAIPPDNPFVGRPGARGEIWALGLRNPWRFSFDPLTREMYIADVGQTRWEEIDLLPHDARGDERDFGWPVVEGPDCHVDAACDTNAFEPPILVYGREQGCAVTGGHVYRGEALPSLRGDYLFGDFCSGIIWRAQRGEGGWTTRALFDTETTISTFGVDAAGEPYFADYARGVLYEIVAADAAP